MPFHDPFPTLEVGPFYCTFEDDRWDEPEIIVDPLSGFVVAIIPSRRRSIWERRPPRPLSTRRDRLSCWLGACAAAPLPVLAAIRAWGRQKRALFRSAFAARRPARRPLPFRR